MLCSARAHNGFAIVRLTMLLSSVVERGYIPLRFLFLPFFFEGEGGIAERGTS